MRLAAVIYLCGAIGAAMLAGCSDSDGGLADGAVDGAGPADVAPKPPDNGTETNNSQPDGVVMPDLGPDGAPAVDEGPAEASTPDVPVVDQSVDSVDSSVPVDSTIPVDLPVADVTAPDAALSCNSAGTPVAGTSGPAGKTDILLVIDDSATMATEHAALFAAIGKLETDLGSSTDYHLGLITTDIGAGNYFSLPSCEDCGGNGLLHSSGTCTSPVASFLSQDAQGVKNFSGTLSQAVQCMATQVGTDGCGFEQPLQAAAIALTNPTINGGFVRPDASLVIVIYTDEDDCSAQNTQLYDPTQSSLTDPLGPLTSFRCFEFGVVCDINDRNIVGPRTNCQPMVGGMLYDVSSYATLFASLKPAGRVGVVVIAGPTDSVAVGKDGTNPVLEESCITAQVSAVPAIRLQALAGAFGAAGAFHSICDALDPAMASVATLAKTL